ncbi:hypothetical protein FIE12Z_9407 [Fusarium flagelliforme]|uniref:Uncharacterized protein n=1 Tax=Fusarium flagelliforme TaxID=2675880 RepID=A0A395MGF2_9HYPO|nr:hypothetical protein FIE12Z_9407 [Fusarium flagelliforme]
MPSSTQTPVALILVELLISMTALVLFCLEYPADFRTSLWENGGVEGFNSNPNQRIYFYANHREPPEIPLIWSQRLATSNLAVAVLGLVVFASRTAMSYLRYLSYFTNIIYDMMLLSLWATSLAGQTSGDFTDPKHPSSHPWYLSRGCSVAWDKTRGYCQLAQASFVVSILVAVLYGTRLVREVVLIAYDRGQRHRSEGFVQITEDIEPMESVYMDEECEYLEQKKSENNLTLSPVLAFFPSDSGSRW